MREITKTIKVSIADYEELDDEQQSMLKMAAEARRNAQATYSKWCVGAAIKGPIIHWSVPSSYYFTGCNIERVCFNDCSHAEVTAIGNMISEQGPCKISKVAIVGGPAEKDVVIPPFKTGELIEKFEDISVATCGHCLQVIWENCLNDGKIELLSLCLNGEVVITTIDSALPIRHGPANLGVELDKVEGHIETSTETSQTTGSEVEPGQAGSV
jgi:cytidine deaminase